MKAAIRDHVCAAVYSEICSRILVAIFANSFVSSKEYLNPQFQPAFNA
jgi:hypothetical protein|tara:strand:- start:988 stop:1131 length:144 start_codon:yes stop_codon:yes gene_type:complete